MPDEFGEHLTRDQRPFLHTGSLQTLQIHSSMLILFPLQFSIGFRSGNWVSHGRTFILCSVTHFCVNSDGPFGSLFCRKIQPRLIIRLSDPKTQLFSAIIQQWSLESLLPLKLSSSHCIELEDNIDTQYTVDRFVTFPVDWNSAIIVLMVEMEVPLLWTFFKWPFMQCVTQLCECEWKHHAKF